MKKPEHLATSADGHIFEKEEDDDGGSAYLTIRYPYSENYRLAVRMRMEDVKELKEALEQWLTET